MKEFNLSEKKRTIENSSSYWFEDRDVKEVINRLKKEIDDRIDNFQLHTVLDINLRGEIKEGVDKLAGEDLK